MSTDKLDTKTKLKYTFYFWVIFAVTILMIGGMFLGTSLGVFGKLPTFEEIENPDTKLATEVISSDGVVLGKYYSENRSPVSFEELSPYLVAALISTEDERFRDHSGIDFIAIVRAVVNMGSKGGGSTITQQLAKMLFTQNPSANIVERVVEKAKEWVIAVQLERHYTKNEIISMYFNKFDFLNQAVGISSAAKIYFSKKPIELNIEESAMLVGMAKNPSLYNPLRRLEQTTARRNIVFNQMERNGIIKLEITDSLSKLPIILDFNPSHHSEGIATYYREYLRSHMKQWIEQNPKPDGTFYNLYTDGLKIYTTIDSRMQKHAEKAVDEHIKNLQRIFFEVEKTNKTMPFSNITKEEIASLINTSIKRSDRYRAMKNNKMSEADIEKAFNTPTEMRIYTLKGERDTIMTPRDSLRHYKAFIETGMMSMEPQTGYVKAWVGGINYKYFKYDHVYQGKRQVGSTFKPFVYTSAVNQLHYSPCFKVPNTSVTFDKDEFGLDKDWTPKNSDGKYGGMLELREALAKSVNTVTAYLMKQIGPRPVKDLAHSMGITSEIPLAPSISLGTADVSLYEMVGAFGSFANQGIYIRPSTILRIEDAYGVVLEEFSSEAREVMSSETAYTMVKMMEGVTKYGTGIRLRTKSGTYRNNAVTGFPYAFENPIAGKTGTSQNHSDGWFMGIVPNLVTGVWVGHEDRSAHFRSIYYGQGATTALPIWGLYMKKVYNDTELSDTNNEEKELFVPSKGNFVPPPSMSIDLTCNDSTQIRQIIKEVVEEDF